jgi:hypothetical protein
MRDGALVMARWRRTLEERGLPATVTWLPHQAMVLGRHLYYRPPDPALSDADILRALQRVPDEEAAVLMVVGLDQGVVFATLLMDAFGSDESEFHQDQNVHFWTSPYVDRLQRVESGTAWWGRRLLQRLAPRLSSLDYAFSLAHARADSA